MGKACVTSAYGLPNKLVIHAIGPNCNIPDQRWFKEKYLSGAIKSSLNLCQEYAVTSVAFCAISTGIFGYDSREAA